MSRLRAFALVLLALATSCSTVPDRRAEPDAARWLRHEGEGFSLEHPAGWRVSADPRSGMVEAAGDGARASVRPFYVAAPLPADLAVGALTEMAAEAEPGATWDKPVPAGDALKVSGTDGDDVIVASMSWSTGKRGTAGALYVAAAPADEYDGLEAAFARIFDSFSVAGPPVESSTRATERWVDPVEGAFSVEIPAGWRAEGGTSRPCPTLVQALVEVTSPDGEIYLAGGDAFPYFTEPIPAFGLPEGSTYPHPCGYSSPVASYAPGNDFAMRYLLPEIAPHARVVRDRARPEVAGRLSSYGLNSYDAGELEYVFTRRGVAYRGMVWTITERIASGEFANWHVWRLFLAQGPEARYEEALSAGMRLVRSLRIDPRWARMQAELTADQVAIVADMGQDISNTITEGYWGRQAVLDDIAERRSNATLEVEDYEDPLTGAPFELESSSDYYWTNPRGEIVGTNTDAVPDVDFRRLVRVDG
jgi:hypothetical protein